MRVEFLGTSSAIVMPRPTCTCRICAEARIRCVPYSRNGPAIFVHGPNLLIDTPEDIAQSINRAGIQQVDAVTWSHWHPDHTAGIRLFEQMNINSREWPPAFPKTAVYIPEGVYADFQQFMDLSARLDYHEQQGLLSQHVIADDESITLNGTTITPYRLPDPGVHAYAYILAEGNRRVFIAIDETFSWQPPADLGHFDLVVLPAGLFEFHPLTGERLMAEEHPLLLREATFRQTLAMAAALDADRVILTHIFADNIVSYDDLMQVQRSVMREHPEVGKLMFAFDRLALMP